MRIEILSLADESRQWDLAGQVRKVPGHLLPVPTFLSRPIQLTFEDHYERKAVIFYTQ